MITPPWPTLTGGEHTRTAATTIPGAARDPVGQVWESPDETIGSLYHRVVFSNADNPVFGDRRSSPGSPAASSSS